MMHIALVHGWYPPPFVHGGIVRYITKLAGGFRTLGHRVTIITRDDSNPRIEEVDGITICRVRVREPLIFRLRVFRVLLSPWVTSSAYAHALRDLHRREPIDLVEFTNYEAEGLAHSFRKVVPHFTRVSTMGWQSSEINSDAARKNRISIGDAWRHYLEGLAIRKSDALITPTVAHAELVKRSCRLCKEPIAVPHGLDLPGSGVVDSTEGNRPIRFLFVGKMDPRKGFDVLIRSFAKIVGAGKKMAHLTVVGSDTNLGAGRTSYLAETLQGIDACALESIQIAGWQSDEKLPDFYRDCDVFVSPSRYESFGLIYLEAMQFGKPVIACDVGGIPEIVKHGETGLLVNPGDEKQLVEAMIRLLDDSNLRHRLGSEGYNRWHSNFREEIACQRSIEEYRRKLLELSDTAFN